MAIPILRWSAPSVAVLSGGPRTVYIHETGVGPGREVRAYALGLKRGGRSTALAGPYVGRCAELLAAAKVSELIVTAESAAPASVARALKALPKA